MQALPVFHRIPGTINFNHLTEVIHGNQASIATIYRVIRTSEGPQNIRGQTTIFPLETQINRGLIPIAPVPPKYASNKA